MNGAWRSKFGVKRPRPLLERQSTEGTEMWTCAGMDGRMHVTHHSDDVRDGRQRNAAAQVS